MMAHRVQVTPITVGGLQSKTRDLRLLLDALQKGIGDIEVRVEGGRRILQDGEVRIVLVVRKVKQGGIEGSGRGRDDVDFRTDPPVACIDIEELDVGSRLPCQKLFLRVEKLRGPLLRAGTSFGFTSCLCRHSRGLTTAVWVWKSAWVWTCRSVR